MQLSSTLLSCMSLMTTVMTTLIILSTTCHAFTILGHKSFSTFQIQRLTSEASPSLASLSSRWALSATTEDSSSEKSVFLPLSSQNDDDDEDDEDEVVDLDVVESLGRGAAKVKRGKRKGDASSSTDSKSKKAAVSLAPEETFYEGPPAITETIIPTISIVTILGIVPAAAAWARQAWVRYKITTRRIRVTSGINGQDMAEIVYPDVVELRTVKRLFGDGDMVLFLRDGARFEMRNIPNFEEAIEFVLKQCDPSVVKAYRAKGDVSL